jgi:hypothetical protein
MYSTVARTIRESEAQTVRYFSGKNLHPVHLLPVISVVSSVLRQASKPNERTSELINESISRADAISGEDDTPTPTKAIAPMTDSCCFSAFLLVVAVVVAIMVSNADNRGSWSRAAALSALQLLCRIVVVAAEEGLLVLEKACVLPITSIARERVTAIRVSIENIIMVEVVW